MRTPTAGSVPPAGSC
uniref:Uncharacterized protein n=1 Tax=Arundo donax TaxID=35708 RepID=A0A0A9E758_ARUDO